MKEKKTNCLTFRALEKEGKTNLPKCPYDSSCDGGNCAMLTQKPESPEDEDQERNILSWLTNLQRRN